jgi:hypothetical protein
MNLEAAVADCGAMVHRVKRHHKSQVHRREFNGVRYHGAASPVHARGPANRRLGALWAPIFANASAAAARSVSLVILRHLPRNWEHNTTWSS